MRREAARVEAGGDEGLDLALLDGQARGQALADQGERLVLGQEGVPGRLVVERLLLGGEAGLEDLDEVGRAHHLGPRGPHHLDRTRVHPAHQGDGRPRAVFHGHPPLPRELRLQGGLELAPGPVQHLEAGRPRERVRLDHVQEGHRLARAGDQVEPAAGADLALVEADHRPGDGIRAPQVVEQPAVEPLLPEGLLDGGEIHHSSTPHAIVHRPPLLSSPTSGGGNAEAQRSAPRICYRPPTLSLPT